MWNLIIIYLFVITINGVQLQQLKTPCPNVFQYQMDDNRDLYGLISVISSNENILQINVEFSVGNPVNSFNGEIQLLTPKYRVVDDLNEGRPIRYKVIFPGWQQIPPQITKIFVNGQLICSGPKLSPSPWITVLTTISLQHRLTLKISPLSSDDDDDDNGVKQRKPTPGGLVKPVKNPFLTNTDILPDNFNINFNPKPPPPPKNNNNNFANNPFLNSWLNNNEDNSNVLNNFNRTTAKPTNWNQFIPNVTLPDPNSQQSNKPTVVPVIESNSNFQPSTHQPHADICGLPVVSNLLIVKGDAVPRGAFPWLAAMFHVKDTGPEYKCSGTLITNRHIVTAAHCVKDDVRHKIRPSDILFVLGKLNIKRWTMLDGERNIEAERIYVHDDYHARISDADIAIILLNDDIVFNNLIRPICLWAEIDDLDAIVGQNGKVVGWGKDEDGVIKAEEPKQTTIPIVSQEACLRSSEAFKFITSNRTFCAGRRDGTGPCNGDSGSGFIMKRNGRWTLRGVVSVSTYDSTRQTCDLSNYVVFTDASKHRDWLLSIITSNNE